MAWSIGTSEGENGAYKVKRRTSHSTKTHTAREVRGVNPIRKERPREVSSPSWQREHHSQL